MAGPSPPGRERAEPRRDDDYHIGRSRRPGRRRRVRRSGGGAVSGAPEFGFVRLVGQNVRNRPFRSLATIFACAIIASTFFTSQYLMSGAQQSLDAGISRMGADILVAPAGYAHAGQTVLLTGEPTTFFLDGSSVGAIAGIPGVAKVSPQIYIATLHASCCAAPVQMIAIDPERDFTISTWLKENPGIALGRDDIIIGSAVVQEIGRDLVFYGHTFYVVGQLERTGTGVDNSVFVRSDDARVMAEESGRKAVKPLAIPDGIGLPRPRQGRSGDLSGGRGGRDRAAGPGGEDHPARRAAQRRQRTAGRPDAAPLRFGHRGDARHRPAARPARGHGHPRTAEGGLHPPGARGEAVVRGGPPARRVGRARDPRRCPRHRRSHGDPGPLPGPHLADAADPVPPPLAPDRPCPGGRRSAPADRDRRGLLALSRLQDHPVGAVRDHPEGRLRDRGNGRIEDLPERRRGDSGRRRRAVRGTAGRVRPDRGAFGEREVHPARHAGRADPADLGHDPDRGDGDRRPLRRRDLGAPLPGDRVRLPVLGAAAHPDRPGERHGPRPLRPERDRDPRQGHGPSHDGGTGGPRGDVPPHALERGDEAGRDRAGPHQQPVAS